MNGQGQYCPVSYAADVLGDRWTVLILREMIGGATHFNEIERGLPKVSRSLLSQRLRHLVQIGVLERVVGADGRTSEYRLSDAGRELQPIVMAMGEWAVRWVIGEPRPDELDPAFIMWWMQRRVNTDALPPGRTTARFDILGDQRDVFWLVLQHDDTSLCVTDPGIHTDVAVEAETVAFHRVYAGRITFMDALKAGTITLRGPRDLTRAFPNWFSWSPFYESTRARMVERAASANAQDGRT
jgi:DNA-binding HxlR family transcriptional regulator